MELNAKHLWNVTVYITLVLQENSNPITHYVTKIVAHASTVTVKVPSVPVSVMKVALARSLKISAKSVVNTKENVLRHS